MCLVAIFVGQKQTMNTRKVLYEGIEYSITDLECFSSVSSIEYDEIMKLYETRLCLLMPDGTIVKQIEL